MCDILRKVCNLCVMAVKVMKCMEKNVEKVTVLKIG